MTVGEGIFWSTIVLVTFVSIVLLTKNKGWKTFFKVAAIVAVIGIVIGSGFWVYAEHENRPQLMSSLNGIQLGMSEVEVTLLKGMPDEISAPEPTTDGYIKFLLFNGAREDSYTAVFLRGKEGSLVVTNVCDKGGYGRVLGFGQYSLEEEIIDKLGKPANISINEKGTTKLLSYPQWNAAFEVEKGHVVEVCVTNRPKMSYSTEYGESKVAGGEN